jgi:predicted RNA polymerase sigma factor
VYLVFNEGYSAETTGAELSREAIRLGRLLLDLLPEPEVMGLLGLMLLQESRRAARSSAEGELILLDQQDRSLWNKSQIAEGISLTESALRSRRFGAYTLQAAIAAVHAEASSAASTDWRQITLLYDRLIRIQPSPVVELNRAVASPCAKVRSRVFVSSMACWRARNSPIITSRTPPVRICVAGWGGFRRPVLRMRRHLPWLGRSRSAVSSPGGCGN